MAYLFEFAKMIWDCIGFRAHLHSHSEGKTTVAMSFRDRQRVIYRDRAPSMVASTKA
ncbi:hypothetical protein QJS10_CPB18g01939 [Acorus calamus]|uniref:Uncharacterized protein n=1 Tax=Acorus calamus TaxID=4465 RepID=A0AAV9CN52_ACOCL|nr:hypothetical protein QJS10_CPB18g01939 [Acorus calamus]